MSKKLRPAMSTAAAIDIGTNSCRLLIRGPNGEVISRLNKITRLGEKVDATGRLQETAMNRTLQALQV